MARDALGRFLPAGVEISLTGSGPRVEGVSKVLQNLKKAKFGLGRELEKGLTLAGLFLQRKSQDVVPIDTGALRNSAFTRKSGEGLSTEIRVGYTQNYAIFVHEDLEARHAPGKIAKYLERPARENKDEIRRIISKAMSGR